MLEVIEKGPPMPEAVSCAMMLTILHQAIKALNVSDDGANAATMSVLDLMHLRLLRVEAKLKKDPPMTPTEERTLVVWWLRSRASDRTATDPATACVLDDYAKMIENGEHLGSQQAV